MNRRPDDPADFYATVQPPRDTQGPRAGVAALARAQALAALVRDHGPDTTGPWLDALTRAELYAVTVALAAMLPVDESPAALLDWIDQPLIPVKDTA